MFETIILSTEVNFASTSVNSTFALATSFTKAVLDNETTDFWNNSESSSVVDSAYNPCHPDNPNFNCSVDDFLDFRLGAKQMPLETALWVSLY